MGHRGSGTGVEGVSGAAMCSQHCWHTCVTTFGKLVGLLLGDSEAAGCNMTQLRCAATCIHVPET